MGEHPAAGREQESVWEYPRPPRIEPSRRRIEVVFNGVTVAESSRTWRILETSHPPVYYITPDDVRREYLRPSSRRTFCEWKGEASYYDVVVGERRAPNAAWYYPDPTPGYADLRNCVAFYPNAMDACLVDGECVQPEAGSFYGGWITADIRV